MMGVLLICMFLTFVVRALLKRNAIVLKVFILSQNFANHSATSVIYFWSLRIVMFLFLLLE